MGGDRAQMYFFFLQICNEVPGEKKRGACRPPTGDRPLSPTPGATGQWARQGGRSPLLRATGGSCRPLPPRATGSGHLYKASPSFPPLI